MSGVLTSRISELTAACVDLLERQVDDSLRKMSKNVIRLCSVQYKEFRACGFFKVDAALPLRLAGLIATYSIVLLQFAFFVLLYELLEIAFLLRPSIETMSGRKDLQLTMRWKDTPADLATTLQERHLGCSAD
ncbi:hypothetical protein EVAR_61221_1 [Eumeta japonica]|uniref:Gustatory receptor n=1 Tax=Eumeta variegata TaxID=151549 RepID=A0A4C1ZAG2_EUMVA|nr:hypothetical protein EVAR_61221_1 [Eumeta japonica]